MFITILSLCFYKFILELFEFFLFKLNSNHVDHENHLNQFNCLCSKNFVYHINFCLNNFNPIKTCLPKWFFNQFIEFESFDHLTKLLEFIRIYLNLFKTIQNYSKLFESIRIHSKLFESIRIYSNLFESI